MVVKSYYSVVTIYKKTWCVFVWFFFKKKRNLECFECWCIYFQKINYAEFLECGVSFYQSLFLYQEIPRSVMCFSLRAQSCTSRLKPKFYI